MIKKVTIKSKTHQEIRVQDLQANEENFFRGGAKSINKIIFIINIKDESLRGTIN